MMITMRKSVWVALLLAVAAVSPGGQATAAAACALVPVEGSASIEFLGILDGTSNTLPFRATWTAIASCPDGGPMDGQTVHVTLLGLLSHLRGSKVRGVTLVTLQTESGGSYSAIGQIAGRAKVHGAFVVAQLTYEAVGQDLSTRGGGEVIFNRKTGEAAINPSDGLALGSDW